MQSNQLILGSSLLALVLCALPYGCSGKSTETPSDGSVGGKNAGCCSDGNVANHPDGNVANHPDGNIANQPDGSHSDGRRYGDGSYVTDGSGYNNHGDGSGPPIFSDGGPSPIPIDGHGVSSDGWDNYPDGDPHSDGTPGDGWDGSSDGQADGFSG
jgi:hypothetical protein